MTAGTRRPPAVDLSDEDGAAERSNQRNPCPPAGIGGLQLALPQVLLDGGDVVHDRG